LDKFQTNIQKVPVMNIF